MNLISSSSATVRLQAFVGLVGFSVLALGASQPAKAVTVSLTSVQAPFICPAGTCVYDVLTTSDVPPGNPPFPAPAITFADLSSGSYPFNGYSYQFNNATAAAAFATAYNASAASNVLKFANDGTLGQKPANPDAAGGPLFFTTIGTATFPSIASTLTTANGQYFTGLASNNFSSNLSGTGQLANTVPQHQVWAFYKCVSGSCAPSPSSVPAPLPMLGVGAAFGYSRRIRRRVNGQLG
jgi:hypothetical protein